MRTVDREPLQSQRTCNIQFESSHSVTHCYCQLICMLLMPSILIKCTCKIRENIYTSPSSMWSNVINSDRTSSPYKSRFAFRFAFIWLKSRTRKPKDHNKVNRTKQIDGIRLKFIRICPKGRGIGGPMGNESCDSFLSVNMHLKCDHSLCTFPSRFLNRPKHLKGKRETTRWQRSGENNRRTEGIA